MYATELTIVVIVVVVSILLFLLLREFWSWYWKINTRISLQEQNIKLLRDIRNLLLSDPEIQKNLNSVDQIEAMPSLDQIPTPKNHSNWKAEELMRIKRLYESGEMVPMEYERQKKELLK